MRRASTVQGKRKTYTVPVFPHVKKFILKNYCKEGSSTRAGIHTDEYTVLGKVVTLSLRDTRLRGEYNEKYRDRLTETLSIVLTKEQSELSPRLHKLMRINIDMDRVFKDHLLSWISALKVAGIPPFTACKMYLEHCNIEEKEYSLDAAYRFWQRSKELPGC